MKVRHSKAKGVNPLRQKWCGPAAISALCGVTVERAAAEINRYREVPTTRIARGSRPEELSHAVRALGFKLVPVDGVKGKTVARILSARDPRMIRRSWRALVFTTRHFFALNGSTAYDNHDLLGWNIRKSGAKHRRGKVREVYVLLRISD